MSENKTIGKQFEKYTYCSKIWVDVKDDEHLLTENTRFETMAQSPEKASSNIKYQIKTKYHLHNSAKIILEENKMKKTKEQQFYAEQKGVKDSFDFAEPNIINLISKKLGKDLNKAGVQFYIVKGEDADYTSEDYQPTEYNNEGYSDLIDNTKSAMEFTNDDEEKYDFTKDLYIWIDQKAYEIYQKLVDECVVDYNEQDECLNKITECLRELFTPNKFYADCNKKSTKAKDSEWNRDTTESINNDPKYRDFEKNTHNKYPITKLANKKIIEYSIKHIENFAYKKDASENIKYVLSYDVKNYDENGVNRNNNYVNKILFLPSLEKARGFIKYCKSKGYEVKNQFADGYDNWLSDDEIFEIKNDDFIPEIDETNFGLHDSKLKDSSDDRVELYSYKNYTLVDVDGRFAILNPQGREEYELSDCDRKEFELTVDWLIDESIKKANQDAHDEELAEKLDSDESLIEI